MIQEFINSVANYAKNGFKNVPENIRQDRLSICKSCEFLIESTVQCAKCGCFLAIKTKWATEKCPIDKWLATEENENASIPQQEIIPQSLNIPQEAKDCGCGNKNV